MSGLKKMLQLVAIVAASACMVACSVDKTTPSKGNMIPDNAVVAVKVDLDQLLNKALGDENSPLRDYWNAAKSGLSGQMRGYGQIGDVAREIIKNPEVSGIQVDEPVVISCSYDMRNIEYDDPSFDLYMVALLDDRSAFVKVADAVAAYARDEEDLNVKKENLGSYTYYEIMSEYGNSLDLGVADKAAVLRLRVNALDGGLRMKDSFAAMFANGGPEKTEGLKEFYDAEQDVAVWVALDAALDSAMPLIEEELDYASVSKLQAYAQMYDDASAVLALDFKEGKTVLNCNIYGSDQLKDAVTKYNKPASDKYLKKMPASAALVANFAIKDFAGLVDMMCAESEELEEIYEESVWEFDFDESLLGGFPGNVSVALDVKSLAYRSEPGFMVCVEADRNVWRYLETYLDEVAEYQGDDVYSVDDEVYVVYEDGHITLVDAETMSTAPMEGTHSFADTEFGDQIEKGGAFVNLASVPGNDLVKFVRREFGLRLSREQILNICSSVVLTTSDDFMSSTLTLNMKDGEHNLLENIALLALPTL